MRQELQIWRRLRHPNILPLLDFFESPMALYAVSPRCPNGSLYHALRRFRKRDTDGHDNHELMGSDNNGGFNLMSSYSSTNEIGGLTIDVTRQIVAQLASALRYLHYDAAVAHGDLKLENVLINASSHVQIIDFGLSRELFDDNSHNNNHSSTTTAISTEHCPAGGSLPYCAPELVRNHQPVSPASDCWALGVMIYALLMGELPFQDAYEPRLIFKIIHAQYELPEEEEENNDSVSGGFCSASDWGALMGASSNSSYNDAGTSSNTKLPSTVIAVIRNLLCVDIKQRWNAQRLITCDWLKNTDPSEPIGLDFAST
jgi:serine/threonine protein kinase